MEATRQDSERSEADSDEQTEAWSGGWRGGGCLLYALIGAVLAFVALVIFVLMSVGGSVAPAADGCQPDADGTTPGQTYSGNNDPSEEALSDIPGNYLDTYRSAGEEYGLDWTIIAAIGKIESDHGRMQPNAQGCIEGPPTPYGTAKGPMQFLDTTWQEVGVDGNGDGQRDVCNYEDAIPGAANYLKMSGAPNDYEAAIFAYNRADWYVRDVLEQAEAYRAAEQNEDDSRPALVSPLWAATGSSLSETTAFRLASLAGWYSGLGRGAPGGARAGMPAVSPVVEALVPRTAEATAQGWDLVSSEKTLYYQSYTSYGPALSHGVGAWNDLGTVDIGETPSGGTTSVEIGDAAMGDGVLGVTYSDGRLLFNTDAMSRATDNAQRATATHELGHALGMGHYEAGPSVMNTPITTNGTSNVDTPSDYDRDLYYQLWGEPDPESIPTDSRDPGAGGDPSDPSAGPGGAGDETSGGPGDEPDGDPGAQNPAVFPMDPEYHDAYVNDWGADRPQGGHEGTDVMGPNGVPLYAIVDGTIQRTAGSSQNNWSELGGWNIMLEADYDIGPIKAGDLLYYAHMDEPPPVEDGQRVRAGEQIGVVGDTGYGPEGTRGQFPPHLHLGWYDMTMTRAEASSGAMNPFPLLEWLTENGGEVDGGTPGGEPRACINPGGPGQGPGGGSDGTGPTGGGEVEPGSGEAQDLIENPNVELTPEAEADLREGLVDERLIAVMNAIAANNKIRIEWFKTGHNFGPGFGEDGPTVPDGYGNAGGAVNSHYFGRGADIFVINDQQILGRGTDPDVLDAGQVLQSLGPQARPDQIIGPTAWHEALGAEREMGFINDVDQTELHNDHLHLGFMQEEGTYNTR